MIKGIFVVAGHGLGPTGGIDNGASGNGTTERKEVVEIASELLQKLWRDTDIRRERIECIGVGIESRMMLKDKIAEINTICRERGWQAHDAIAVSIHINAAGSTEARGVETWYSPEEGTIDLARSIAEQTAAATGLPLRPRVARITSENRHGRLGIIDDTIPKGCLVEVGFITNELDAEALKNALFDDTFALGILQGIRQYLALPDVTPPHTTGLRDVPADAWFAEDVALCIEQGLFQNPPDGLFHPERPISRAELAAVMARHIRKHHSHLEL